MKLIISDIDNTLGINEIEIVNGIHLLNNYRNLCDICYITGRSLTSLIMFNSYFTLNTYLSPWGGGNLLKIIPDNKLKRIYPITPFEEYRTDKLSTKVFIPKSKTFSMNDEITLNDNSIVSNSLVCVGAFREIEKIENDLERNLGLNNTYYKLYSPFKKPRLHLVELFKNRYETIIYLGDDHPDVECVSYVDYFLAPLNSIASNYKPTGIYKDHNTLKLLLDTIII